MKSKLKTVRFQAAASNYMKNGSLNITESRDLFLYNTVTRTAKPKNLSLIHIFSEYSSENSKKAKLERLLVKKGTPLQNSKIRRDIRKAFERILIPLGNADQDLLPARMHLALSLIHI